MHSHSHRFYDNAIKIMGFGVDRISRVHVDGLENIPKTGGAILIANHVSHVDPIVLGVKLRGSSRRSRAMAKASLFSVPVLGKVFARMGHIPVYRNSDRAVEALRAAIAAINDGEVVALYPEGTVPKDGRGMGEFKSGAARLALATGAPVVPIGHVGACSVFPAVRERSSWRYIVSALRHRPEIRVQIGEPYFPSRAFTVPDPDDRVQVRMVTEEMSVKVRRVHSSLTSAD